jgi:hypothetical protein
MLFGLLALQNTLIEEDQLIAAVRAWSGDKLRPIAEHLVERGSLDSADRAAVEAILERHLKKHGDDTQKSLAAITVGRASGKSLTLLGDPVIEQTLATVGSQVKSSTAPDAQETLTLHSQWAPPAPLEPPRPTARDSRCSALTPRGAWALSSSRSTAN